MIIKLRRQVVVLWSTAKRQAFGVDKEQLQSKTETIDLDISELPLTKLRSLAAAMPAGEARRQVQQLISLRSRKVVVATDSDNMLSLLKYYLSRIPHGRLYRNLYGQWYAYYVADVVLTVPSKRHERPGLRILLQWQRWGRLQTSAVQVESAMCVGRSPEQLLKELGLSAETEEIYAEYLRGVKLYRRFIERVGLQCTASGIGFPIAFDSLVDVLKLEPKAVASPGHRVRVVVDQPSDDDESLSNYVEMRHYKSLANGLFQSEPSRDELADMPSISDEWTEAQYDAYERYLVPTQALVPVFDLNKHRRYSVPALSLRPHQYQVNAADKLILPEENKRFLAALIRSDGKTFTDLVENKSGGRTILVAGPPGVGKTLSAEVFAERTKRPLYRIQCSQLGIDPDCIEEKLQQAFARAERWKAVLLLDEADLYISRRGTDLRHNAIVCVFLRVLEYQNTLLFLTTNRPEDVDDGVASRCVGRMTIEPPTPDRLRKIWRGLADSAGIAITQKTIDEIVQKYPGMSGRDVKSALKLLMLYLGEAIPDELADKPKRSKSGVIVTTRYLEFVMTFHPNHGGWSSASHD